MLVNFSEFTNSYYPTNTLETLEKLLHQNKSSELFTPAQYSENNWGRRNWGRRNWAQPDVKNSLFCSPRILVASSI